MVSLRLSALALLVASAWPALAAEDDAPVPNEAPEVVEPPSTPDLAIKITASFPSSEIFGVKIVNGRPTECLLSIENNEPEAVQLALVGGALWTPEGAAGAPNPPQIMRNLTAARYGSSIPAGESESFTYTFTNDMHPQELDLRLSAILQGKGAYFTYTFFNATVTVAEAPLSFFDPQIIFLYLLLAGGFGGVVLFIWNTWSPTLFPQQKKAGKGGERAKKSSLGSKKVNPAEQVSVVGADGPAVTSGAQAQAWSNEWVDSRHTQKPVAKRLGSSKSAKGKGGLTVPSSP